MNPARFLIANAHVVRINRREKVTYLTLLTASERGSGVDYWDVTAFRDCPTEAVQEGQAVTVKGSLSRRKPQEGSKGWTTELVARSIEAGDEALTPRAPASKPVSERTVEQAVGPAQAMLDGDDVPF